MKKILRAITAKLVTTIGAYFFIEIEEKQREFGQTGLRQYRVIVRALSVRSAISAAHRHCLTMGDKDGRQYELSFIQRI